MRVRLSPIAVRGLGAIVGCLLLTATGCRNPDPVHETKEPKPEFELPYVEPPHPEKMTILGGIAPGGDGSTWWFFKMSGPAERVRQEHSQFDAFVDSLEFDPLSKTVWKWKTPADWIETPVSGNFTFAKYRMGGDVYENEPGLAGVLGYAGYLTVLNRVEENYPLFYPEMSVSMLNGNLLDNVNRWRDQLGLPRLLMADLNRIVELRPVGNAVLFTVDMSGPTFKGPPRAAAPFAKGH